MIRTLSRATQCTLACAFLLISLLITLMLSYEWLAVKLANHYLRQYDTKITELSLYPRSLTHWQLPKLVLVVKGSDIRIQDLELTFDNRFSLLNFSANQLATISLGKIAVVLNPNVLSNTGKNLDEQGPTLGLDITQLPQIEMGQTSLSLKGIPSSALSLNLTHLTLDKLGHLTSQLTQHGQPLFTLDAHLTDNKWSISSSIVFEQLYTLLNNIAKHPLTNSAFNAVLAMKTKLDKQGIYLSGTLNSQAELDLKTAQLHSIHQLIGTQLILSPLADLALIPNTALAQSSLLVSTSSLTHIESKPNQMLEFEIGGHITDLSLTVLPFSIQVTPKPQQTIALLALIKNKTLLKAIEPLQTTKSNEPLNQLTATLSLRDPLKFSFLTQKISSPDIRLSIVNNTISTNISLKALSLVLPHHVQSLALSANWSFNLITKTQLALQPLLPQSLNALELHLANTTMTTKGTLQLKQVNDTHDGVTQTQPIFTLSVDNESSIVSDKLTLRTVQDKQTAITMKIGSLSLSNLTPLKVSYASDTLSVVLPRLVLRLDPVTYHYQPSLTPNDITFEANNVIFRTSAPSDFTVNMGSKDLQPLALKPTQFTGARFSLEAEKISFLDKKISKQAPLAAPSIAITAQKAKLSSLTPFSLEHAQENNAQLTLILPKFEFKQTETEFIQVIKDPAHVQEKNPANIKIATTKTPLSQSLNQALTAKLPYFTLTILDSTNLAFMLDKTQHWPHILSQAAWRNRAHYQLEGLTLTRSHHKNKRLKTEKILQLNHATIKQAFNWSKPTLTTQEAWSLGELQFNSTHQVTLDLTRQNVQKISVQGEAMLESELSEILAIVDASYPLPATFHANGHATLETKYRFTPVSTSSAQKTTLLAVDFSPTLTEVSGSMNELPFEKAMLNAKCQLRLHHDDHRPKEQSSLACDEINLSARAFNPGVLIEDFDSHASLFIPLDSEPKKPSPSVSVPTHLTHADIQMNASGKLLGGKLTLPEFTLNLKERSHGYLVLQGLNLAELIAIQPQIGLYANGTLDGVLPVDLVDGKVSVSGGRLATRAPGGLITLNGNPAVDQMRDSQPYLDFAFSTMEHLEYSELSTSFDMAPTGDAILHLNVKGKGKGVERPIHLNYSQEENMLQLLRSLQIGDKLQTQIEQSIN